MRKSLRAKWNDAGYGLLMGSAEVVPPPPKEFIRVYHLTSAEFGVNDIALARMKVASFSDLNDPFELLSLNFKERKNRAVVQDFKTAYEGHTGLLCFSANWTDPVLWSHYGARHRGVCLGFDLATKRAERVRYEDERVLAKLGDDADPLELEPELQRLLLCTKFRHWQYEREIRTFVEIAATMQEGKLHFYSFDETLRLREVILGPLCDLSLESIRQLVSVRYADAVVFKARLAIGSFDVVPLEPSVP